MSLKSLLLSTLLLHSPVASLVQQSWDTSGCGKAHDPGYHNQTSSHSLMSGGIERRYGINIPQSYLTDNSTPRKLIVDYHGKHGTPSGQYNNSKYFDHPKGEEYIVVYPHGTGPDRSWESAPYAATGVDDLLFTKTLLKHLRREYCIDSHHIYASGKSNGGGFVDYLACSEEGNEFAAFAMSSAALYSENKTVPCLHGQRPRPILEAHGQEDHTISYGGGLRDEVTLPSIREWIGWWAVRDGCDANKDKPVVSGDLGGYQTIIYSCGGLKNVSQHYDVFNLGHCWPISSGNNTDGRRSSKCDDRSLDFTQVVLDFFEKWNLTSTSDESHREL